MPRSIPARSSLDPRKVVWTLLLGCASACAIVGCGSGFDGTFGEEDGAALDPGSGDDARPQPPVADAAPGRDGGGGSADGRPSGDGAPTPPSDTGPPPPPPVVDAGPPPATSDLAHCVDVINSYRAKVGAKPYARSAALEAFAAEGAKEDSVSGSPHGHFMSTSGGGVAWAENEIPGWPADGSGGVRGVIDDGLKMMWDEGPGGGHHDNMASGEYTEAGCGLFVTADKQVWVVQDFH